MSDEVQSAINDVNNMSHYELAKLWRFGPSDHLYISTPEIFETVRSRLFEHFGGITTIISKQVGWDE